MRFLWLVAGLTALAWGLSDQTSADITHAPTTVVAPSQLVQVSGTQVSPFASTESTDSSVLRHKDATTHAPNTCQKIAVEGTHSAELLDDARLGALEDVKDVCPSNKFTATLGNCELRSALGDESNEVYRCRQKGVCEVCGDDLKRVAEAQS